MSLFEFVSLFIEGKQACYILEIPTSIEGTKRIDAQNGETMWMNIVNKEITNVGIAFDVLEQWEKAPPGWRKASGHLVYGTKTDFTRKAIWVKYGQHMAPNPTTSSYDGVVRGRVCALL